MWLDDWSNCGSTRVGEAARHTCGRSRWQNGARVRTNHSRSLVSHTPFRTCNVHTVQWIISSFRLSSPSSFLQPYYVQTGTPCGRAAMKAVPTDGGDASKTSKRGTRSREPRQWQINGLGHRKSAITILFLLHHLARELIWYTYPFVSPAVS